MRNPLDPICGPSAKFPPPPSLSKIEEKDPESKMESKFHMIWAVLEVESLG